MGLGLGLESIIRIPFIISIDGRNEATVPHLLLLADDHASAQQGSTSGGTTLLLVWARIAG
jgi:hypothetical protein